MEKIYLKMLIISNINHTLYSCFVLGHETHFTLTVYSDLEDNSLNVTKVIPISLLLTLINISFQGVGLLTCFQGDDIILRKLQGQPMIYGCLEMSMMD